MKGITDIETLNKWQVDVAVMFREMELNYSREQIADCLLKVYEAEPAADLEPKLEIETKIGYLILNRLVLTLYKSKKPEQILAVTLKVA